MVIFHTVISRIFSQVISNFCFFYTVMYDGRLLCKLILRRIFVKIISKNRANVRSNIYFIKYLCPDYKLPHSMHDSTNCTQSIESKSWIFLTITVQWFEPSLKASNPGPKFWNQNSTRIPNKVRTNKPPVNNLSFR